MPAIITHHLFGEEATALLPEGIIDGQEELLAFLLGNQGPDPLWAHMMTLPSVARTCSDLATAMHSEQVVKSFMVLREAVSHLPEKDKRIGRAFVLGMLGHYTLDSTAHPFVRAQQMAICDTSAELASNGDEVHAIIESDLDTWLLWEKRGQTVEDTPTTAYLVHTDSLLKVAGSLFTQVAWQVYNISLGANAYGNAIRDYQLVYSIVDPAPSYKSDLITLMEPVVPKAGYLRALGHYPKRDDYCAAANLEHRTWEDPNTGTQYTSSFDELFDEALKRWPTLAEVFIAGNDTRLRNYTNGLNYDGKLVE